MVAEPQTLMADGLDVAELPLCDVKTVGVYFSYDDLDAPAAVADATEQAALLGGTIVRIVARDPANEPEFPVMGVKEFSAAAGIERHYGSQKTREADFPAETAVLAAGPVWDIADIARYLRDRAAGAGRSRRRRRR